MDSPPRSIDTSDPHDVDHSKASALIPPRWPCRRTSLSNISMQLKISARARSRVL